MTVAIAGLVVIPSLASAAKRDVYVLDVGRSPQGQSDIPGRIIKIDPRTRTQHEIVPHGPGVETLHNPTGITVDAQGFLIVADNDGYGDNAGGSCINGCGAVLRVNPQNGAATVLSKGQLWSNPNSVLLPKDGDIVDGNNDVMYVADAGEGAIVKVDLSQQTASDGAKQTLYPSNANPLTGLYAPWDIARDPTNGDFLVTNLGTKVVGHAPLTGVAGCDDDPSQPGFSESDGFVIRVRNGKIVHHYCDDDFATPRGVALADKRTLGTAGTMFVTDPLTESVNSGGQVSYTTLFQIHGARSQALSGDDLFATPSGLGFTYSGKGLLVADEGDCAPPQGCGKVVAVNPISGDQAVFASGGLLGERFPIDVAVDRRGARGPHHRRSHVKTVHLFGPKDPSLATSPGTGTPVGIIAFPFRGFSKNQKVRIECLRPCTPHRLTPKTLSPRHDRVEFHFPSQHRSTMLTGRFRIVTYVPRHGHSGASYQGRFATYKYSVGDNGPRHSHLSLGCLKPGATKVRNQTRVRCPKPSNH
jgi:hypothetical protein